MAKVFKTQASHNEIRYKFEIRVSRNIRESYDLYKANNNILWKEAIEMETGQLLDYKTFKILHKEK